MYRGIALSFVLYEQQGREKDLPAYLAEISLGGFGAVEMRLDKWFGTKESTEAVSIALRVDGTRMYTAFVEAALDDAATAAQTVLGIAAAVDRAKARDLDFKGVVLVPFAGTRARTDAETDAALARVQQLGSSLQRRGIWLALHNDAAESADEARLYRRLLDATAADANIGAAVDVEWIQRGGGKPAAFVEQYKGRLKTLHLRQARGGVWSEDLGDGDVDLRAVDKVTRPLKTDIQLIAELNFHPETKLTRRLVDDLKLTRQYIRKVFTV